MAYGGYVRSRLTLIRFMSTLRLYKRIRKTIEDARNATIQKIRAIMPRLDEARKAVYSDLEQISGMFKLGAARAGIDEVSKLGELVPPTVEVVSETREYEGIRFSAVKFVNVTSPNYSIFSTPPELDLAVNMTYKSLNKLLDLINLESIFYMLLSRAKEYQRMYNALEHVLIPRLDTAIRELRLALDEMEREDYIRRKIIQTLVVIP